MIALDGERELELDHDDRVAIWLDRNGSRTIEIDRVMALAAQMGLLPRVQPPVSRAAAERSTTHAAE